MEPLGGLEDISESSDDSSNLKFCIRERSRIQKECIQFFKWRWKWLFAFLFIVFLPTLLLLPSKFSLWFLMNVTGYIYVAGATEGRNNPLSSRCEKDGPKEFLKLLLSTPVMYYLGPFWTLLDASENQMTIFDNLFGYSLHWESEFSYYLYNWLFYIVPFFIGLHFTYLDHIPFLQKIAFSKSFMVKFRPSHWLLLFFGTAFICAILSYQFYLFYIHERWIYPLISIGIAIFFLVLIRIAKKIGGQPTYIHVHHYQIGGVLMLFTPFQNIVSSISQALAAGVYVEGVARWGMGDCTIFM